MGNDLTSLRVCISRDTDDSRPVLTADGETEERRFLDSLALNASKSGHVTVLRVLHKLGVDVTVASKVGITLAHVASANGHVDVLQALCELGSNYEKWKSTCSCRKRERSCTNIASFARAWRGRRYSNGKWVQACISRKLERSRGGDSTATRA